MTPEEVTRRNEAIALYMGWKLVEDYWEMDPNDECPDCNSTISRDSLDFHLHWWRIMPVVEKILKESGSGLHVLPGGGGSTARFGMGQNIGWNKNYTPIEAVWMAVSEWVLSRETQNPGNGKEA